MQQNRPAPQEPCCACAAVDGPLDAVGPASLCWSWSYQLFWNPFGGHNDTFAEMSQLPSQAVSRLFLLPSQLLLQGETQRCRDFICSGSSGFHARLHLASLRVLSTAFPWPAIVPSPTASAPSFLSLFFLSFLPLTPIVCTPSNHSFHLSISCSLSLSCVCRILKCKHTLAHSSSTLMVTRLQKLVQCLQKIVRNWIHPQTTMDRPVSLRLPTFGFLLC